jgi:response regulator of citrate/malate metabolism
MENYQLNESVNKLANLIDSNMFHGEITPHGMLSGKDLMKYFSAFETKKVLIVEDDPCQMALIEELVCDINSDADIDWELSGEKAMARIFEANQSLHERPYDLIISDVMLGGDISGIDLADICKKKKINAQIVLVSAYPKEKLFKTRYHQLPTVSFLQKPLNYSLFKQEIEPLLAS